MIESSVAVEIDNLGQVFACIGLMECEAARAATRAESDEAAAKASPERSLGRFDIDRSERGTRGRFTLASASGQTIGDLLIDLLDARVVSLRPAGTDLADKQTDTADFVAGERVFPAPPPSTASALPVELVMPNRRVRASSWSGNLRRDGRDPVKFWAGVSSGAKLTELALSLVRDLTIDERTRLIDDPFAFAAPQSSSYRLDRRRDYVPIDAGFSPNQNTDVKMVGYPLVELLAAIGLENARPRRRDRLRYTYAVPTVPMPLTMLRAVVGDGDIGMPCRRFEALLGFPGDEKQRCITDTREIE